MNPFEELQQLVEQAQEERRLLQMGHKPIGDSLTVAAAILGRINTLIKETQAAKALAEVKPETEPQAEPTPVVAPVVAPADEPEQAIVTAEPEPLPSADPAPVAVDTHAKRKAK